MSEPFTRHISCHCQKHVLKLTMPVGTPFEDFGVCDCSHCLKRRIVWHMAPENSMEIIRGFGKDGVEVQSYEFGSKSSSHQVCAECGTHLLGDKFDPTKKTMYNMRAIRDLDHNLWELPLKLYSGVDRKPDYVWPVLSDIPGAEEHLKAIAKEVDYPTEILVGSCHCQAIKFAVLSKPLEEAQLDDCGCSICSGNGDIWLRVPRDRRSVYFHPHASAEETYLPPADLINEYGFMERRNLHYMCKNCGIQVYEYGPRPVEDPRPKHAPPEVIARRKPWEQENGYNGGFGFNAMLLNDIGEYLRDVQCLPEGKEGDKGTKRLKCLNRNPDDITEEPRYILKL